MVPVNSWLAGLFCKIFLSSVDCYLLKILKKLFKNTMRVLNSLNPDQARHFVGPDLDPNCLKRLAADDNSGHWQERVKRNMV